MISHMTMVFAAEGLDGPEKLLLLAYTNYTDMHGYCWPSEARLADDCGTSLRTVQRVKARLVKKKLAKSVRRKNRHGEPISNLTRINLPELASMARKRDQYDDDLIGAITFDDDTQGDPEATLGGTPDEPEMPSDLLTRHDGGYPPPSCQVPPAKMAGTYRQDGGQSVIDPSEIPLSPRGRARVGDPAAAAPAVEEREKAATPKDKNNRQPAKALPGQRAGGVDKLERVPTDVPGAFQPFQAPVPTDAPHTPQPMPQAAAQKPAGSRQTAATATQETAAFVEGLPGGIGRLDVPRLAHLVAAAQTEGWTLRALREYLVTHVDASRVFAHATLYEKHLRNLPARGATPAPAAEQPERWECVDCRNPYRGAPPADGLCGRCRAAAEQAAAELAARLAGIKPTTLDPQRPACPGHNGKPCGRPVVAGADMCGRCGCAASAATARR